MVIILMIVAVLWFSWAMVFMRAGALRTINNAISALLVMVTIGLLMLHDNLHLGMQQDTTTTKTTLVSSLAKPKQPNILLYQPLGTAGKAKIVIYRTDIQQARAKKTSTNNATVKIKRVPSATPATLIYQQTRWVYQNDFWAFAFAGSGQDTVFDQQQYDFAVPQGWLVVTPKQLKTQAKAAGE